MLLLKEAAQILNVQPATLRQQIKNGRLYADKIGRDWHVSRSEVTRYARESQNRELRRSDLPSFSGILSGSHVRY